MWKDGMTFDFLQSSNLFLPLLNDQIWSETRWSESLENAVSCANVRSRKEQAMGLRETKQIIST